MPPIFAVLVAMVAFLGALASTSGTTHTNVANQLRKLIEEFHNLNLSNQEERERAQHHLQVLQVQIKHFLERTIICKRIHIFSYCSVSLPLVFVPFAISDSPLQVMFLAGGMLIILLSITWMRIKELTIGGDTIQIAADEVLDTRLEIPFKALEV